MESDALQKAKRMRIGRQRIRLQRTERRIAPSRPGLVRRGAGRAGGARHPSHWLAPVSPSSPAAPRRQEEAAAAEDPAVRRQRVEAVLLLSKSPLSPRKVAQLAGLADATEARTLIRQLNENYERLGRAFRAEEVAGGYQLLTRAALAPWLRRLGHLPPEIRLSSPAMETLAIVAYRHPVLRADIEAIRGVACGDLLRQLMDRDLVRICGRSEELGRPYLYGTTKRFLQVFGLRSPDALPKADFSFETMATDLDDSTDSDASPASPLDPGDAEQEPDVSTALAHATLAAPPQTDPQADEVIPVVGEASRETASPADPPAPQAGLDEDEETVWDDEEDDDEKGGDEKGGDDAIDDGDEEEDDWDDDWDDDDDDDDDDDLDEEDDEELDDWEEVGDEDLDEDDDDDDDDLIDEEEEEDWD